MTKRMTHAALLTLWSVIAVPAVLAADAGNPSPPARIVPTDGPVTATTGTFIYDPSGNVAAIGASFYVYDPMGRVTTASVDRFGNAASQTYTYDVYGNRLTDGTLSYPVDEVTNTNRMTGFAAQYDVAGNLTQWQPPYSTTVRSFSHDALNTVMREKVTVGGGDEFVVHIYTADDERYWNYAVGSADVESRYTLRDLGGQVLREFVETTVGSTQTWSARDYIYRDGLLLASHDTATGDTHHYSLDHLGTPRVVTDQNHMKVAEHTYFPFGAEYTDGSVMDGRLRFTGHEERDSDLLGENRGELDYMHARYYQAGAGRFLTVDPGEVNLQGPQSWNRYSYALNSPVVFGDPDGRNVWFTGTSKEDRKAAFDALRESLNDPWAASRLLMVKVGDHFEARIAGGPDEFKNGSDAAFTVGVAIGVSANIGFGFGKVDQKFFGATTKPVGDGTRDSNITIDRGVFPQMLGDTYQNISTALHHELGHAIAFATLSIDSIVQGNLIGGHTNETSLYHENLARRTYIKQIEVRFGKDSAAARAARSIYAERLKHGH